MKTNIPIYRGKKLDGGEYIYGDLLTELYEPMNKITKLYYFLSYSYSSEFGESVAKHKIDPSTLMILINDSWLSMEQLNKCVSYCKEFDMFSINKGDSNE